MDGQYNPARVEEEVFQFWREQHLFVPSEEEADNPSYAILMPPPNVTNVLHLGHALNNTLQDVMARYYRMKGRAVLWKIGVDHAGIATQNMVERELAKEGLDRFSMGRERFLERVWEWKRLYGHRILDQLKRLGVSGDWEHDRFTMDSISSRAVKEIFVKLYQDDLLYRGEYLINWCVHCLTTISDDEVEHVEHQGLLYEIAYPLTDSDNSIIVATTRPETIIGDVALAVSPDDERYQAWVGKKVRVPLVGREIPIITDEAIQKDFGTGVLKVTPGYDPVDFEIGRKYKLPSIEIMDNSGKMNAEAGEYEGMDRFEYRKVFVRLLSEAGFLVSSVPYQHARGTCYRCHNVIEYRISTQWFVRMAPLAQKAKEVVSQGQVRFVPEKWEKVYHHWMDHIKDWSISRQLWWGHPIPASYCSRGHINVGVEAPSACVECGDTDLTPDPDVLDTWFSSWIWPFTVFDCQEFTKQNWKTSEFLRYYPTQYLATAPEILFFWVARMIMAGMYLVNEVPFSQVFFNSTVCDMQGRKMSKSLGNGIDPMDIITEHGADALRFTLLFIAPKGERVRMEKKSFETGGRLINKLWNAARFIFSQKPKGSQITADSDSLDLGLWESFIVGQYRKTLIKAEQAIESFDYYTYSHVVYHFFWNDFCDWFLEAQKLILKASSVKEKNRIYLFLEKVLDGILRLFHPVIPFITEKIWQDLETKSGVSLMKKDFSIFSESIRNLEKENKASQLIDLVTEIRSIRTELQIQESLQLGLPHGEPSSQASKKSWLWEHQQELLAWCNISLIQVDLTSKTKSFSLSSILDIDLRLIVPDSLEKENLRGILQKALKKAQSEKERAQSKVSNVKFRKNALEELVLAEQEKILRFEKQEHRLLQFMHYLES